jgi:predicted transposase/invertase (TIGR01784 family)
VPQSLNEVPALHHAFEVAKQSRLSRKELEVLEKRQMFLHDNRNAILYAEQKREKKGRKEGRQEGERLKALEIARQLLDVLDIETIAQKTGLSIGEIGQLFEPKLDR